MSRFVFYGRMIYGAMFILGGAVKTRSFGKAFAPTLFGYMSEAFAASHDVLSMADSLTPIKFQEAVGYVEMLCGFMLMSGQLVILACTVLMIVMLGAFYTLHALDQPAMTLASTFLLFSGLLMLAVSRNTKEKEE